MNRYIDFGKDGTVIGIRAFTPPQSFTASVALRRPDDFCAVAPKATRVKHHEERRRNTSLAAGTLRPVLP